MVPPIEATASFSPSPERHNQPLVPEDLAVHDLWHYDRHLPSSLFEGVAARRDLKIFPDGKSIVDARPLYSLGHLISLYGQALEQPGFSPTRFFTEHFSLPDYTVPEIQSGRPRIPLDKYISETWSLLTYDAPDNNGSLIGSPNPTLKPGERFGEAYYWDLLEGARGLLTEAANDDRAGKNHESAQKEKLVRGVADNLAYQIETEGYISNGRRTYYQGRSQTPVFVEIVKTMQEHFGKMDPGITQIYLPQLEKEYAWWNSGERIVRLEDYHGRVHYLNRHWDANDTPRPESYQEDIETANRAYGRPKNEVYRHIRAAAETGRDFTARLLADPRRLETIHTTDFIPLELNAQLYLYETEIAKAHLAAGRINRARHYNTLAAERKRAIDTFLWNEAAGGYFDYDFVAGQQSEIKSMGMAYMVAAGASSKSQSERVAGVLKTDLLKRGGFAATLADSTQQWDGMPDEHGDKKNGWPIDQVKGIQALEIAGEKRTALMAAFRWLSLNRRIYRAAGVMVEKSEVVQLSCGGGGEYARAQKGFLWSNGVDRYLSDYLRRQMIVGNG
ncbi:MAG TPA: trehalase family glycosidase [Candidatus Saccharimonadales bacterium]|nr:trehalase family glycosidase [Candidatus Saccharimonadales bacterium]